MQKSDIWEFKRPGVAVDVIVFTIINNQLHVGLLKRQENPHEGKWALPGRFVRYDEPIEDTAKVALKNKLGLENVFLEQLYSFGQNLERDDRIRTISITYIALLRHGSTNKLVSGSQWHSIGKLPAMAWDHKEILHYALNRLKGKIWYTNIAFQLLSEKFTLTELQVAYEAVLGEKLDKRNFRKRIKAYNLLTVLDEYKMEGAHRPAKLYKFKK